MERHPRKNTPLVISPAVAGVLGAWRQAAGVVDGAQLDVDRVRDVEGTMGTGFPDPILAVFAAAIPVLAHDFGMGLGKVAEHSARARAKQVRGDFVACGAEPDESGFYGFLKKTGDTLLAVFRPRRGRVETTPYAEWLRVTAAKHAVELDAVAPPFEPRLIRNAEPMGEGQRVRHPKWGVGRVLAEFGDGPTRKVKAAFPGLGLKTVQARFLEYL